MARPIKKGLDYFPLDVNFLKDIKVRKILRANGDGSISILVDLLGNIYGDEGYYMQWDDDMRFLVADDVGASEGRVDEVVNKAVQVGFFDKGMFEKYQILTSRGIQKRYQSAAARKTDNDIKDDFRLLYTKTLVSVYKNPRSSELSPTKSTQSKVKESKVNKSKVNNNHDDNTKLSPINHWQEIYISLNTVQLQDLNEATAKF